MMSDGGIPSIPPSIRGMIMQDSNPNPSMNPNPNNSNSSKRKRSLPGTPDPEAEVIALSPKSLMTKNRFICEICNKGFQRDQNLQLHRRGHNLPWKLKQRSSNEVVRKKVYICPEKTCVHHDPARALGDLTGVKKHYSRKHGEKKWKCEKCSKKYAVHSDLKAHSKVCGTREYKCDCGTIFSRKDSFITHRAFCDALAGESVGYRTPVLSANLSFRNEVINGGFNSNFSGVFRPEIGGFESGNQLNLDNFQKSRLPVWLDTANPMQIAAQNQWLSGSSSELPDRVGVGVVLKEEEENKGSLSEGVISSSSLYYTSPPPALSATALLQKAAEIGSTRSNDSAVFSGFGLMNSPFSNMGGFDYFHQTRNEAHQKNLDSNLSGFMASNSASTLTSNNGDHNLVIDDTNSSLINSKINEGDHTRDFLGVGVNENRQFLQEFASEMEMSHYCRNH